MKNKILNLIKKKFIFFEDKKYQVIIFDKFLPNLNIDKFCSYRFIQNEIFIDCLIKSICKSIINFQFNKSYLSINYLKFLIRKFQCKVVICNEFKKSVFAIKEKNVKTIVYQIADHLIQHQHLLKKILTNTNLNHLPQCTYYLIKHKKYKKMLNFIKTKFIISGSVLNNAVTLKKNVKKKYDITFISHFRNNQYKFYGYNNMMFMQANHTSMFYIVKIISEFCTQKKKSFSIALTSNRIDKSQYKNLRKQEVNFFSSAAPNFKYEYVDAYKLAEKSELIISTYSTLGLELLSQGKKVLFLDPIHFTQINYIYQFTRQNNNGYHWYGGSDKKIILYKIMRLLNLSHNSWNNRVKKSPFFIKYDQNNSILTTLIKNSFKGRI